jgi:hypothetical protein
MTVARKPYRITSVVSGSPESEVDEADQVGYHGRGLTPRGSGNQVFVLEVDAHRRAGECARAFDGHHPPDKATSHLAAHIDDFSEKSAGHRWWHRWLRSARSG